MATYNLTWALNTPASSQTVVKSLTGSGQIEIDETIANGQTDKVVAVGIDISQIVAIEMCSDVALTVETNATNHAGGNEIVLVAGLPYRWCTNDYNVKLLTADVTIMYLTNASGSTANFSLRVLYDATP
jgi:hypothetical protein